MVIGAATAPCGKVIVRPVSGMEIVPPEESIVFETRTTSLCQSFHHSASSSRLVAVGAASGDALRRPVGLGSPKPEQDVITKALRTALSERNKCDRIIYEPAEVAMG